MQLKFVSQRQVIFGYWTGNSASKHSALWHLALITFSQTMSFRDGSGTDGFVEVASLSQLNPDIGVMTVFTCCLYAIHYR